MPPESRSRESETCSRWLIMAVAEWWSSYHRAPLSLVKLQAIAEAGRAVRPHKASEEVEMGFYSDGWCLFLLAQVYSSWACCLDSEFQHWGEKCLSLSSSFGWGISSVLIQMPVSHSTQAKILGHRKRNTHISEESISVNYNYYFVESIVYTRFWI